eukprot:12112112-Alexandrium_andersonii.AAC.2
MPRVPILPIKHLWKTCAPESHTSDTTSNGMMTGWSTSEPWPSWIFTMVGVSFRSNASHKNLWRSRSTFCGCCPPAPSEANPPNAWPLSTPNSSTIVEDSFWACRQDDANGDISDGYV